MNTDRKVKTLRELACVIRLGALRAWSAQDRQRLQAFKRTSALWVDADALWMEARDVFKRLDDSSPRKGRPAAKTKWPEGVPRFGVRDQALDLIYAQFQALGVPRAKLFHLGDGGVPLKDHLQRALDGGKEKALAFWGLGAFGQWLSQQDTRDDWVGDAARDAKIDPHFPWGCSREEGLSYFMDHLPMEVRDDVVQGMAREFNPSTAKSLQPCP